MCFTGKCRYEQYSGDCSLPHMECRCEELEPIPPQPLSDSFSDLIEPIATGKVEDMHLEFVKRQLRKTIEEGINKNNTPTTRAELAHDVTNILKQFAGSNHDKISLEFVQVDNNETLELRPKNLYTALLLNGVSIPYELVEGKDRYIHGNMLYKYNYETGILEAGEI